jgi:hypothetical protein
VALALALAAAVAVFGAWRLTRGERPAVHLLAFSRRARSAGSATGLATAPEDKLLTRCASGGGAAVRYLVGSIVGGIGSRPRATLRWAYLASVRGGRWSAPIGQDRPA